MKFITEKEFKKASLGSVYMVACPECEAESGDIILKRKGKINKDDHPNTLMFFPQICEFCLILKQIRHDDNSVIGMVKCVNNKTGDLITFIGISKGSETLTREGKDDIPLEHGMVLEAKDNADESFTILGVKNED